MAKNLRQDEGIALEQDPINVRRQEASPPPAPPPAPPVQLPTSIGTGSPTRRIHRAPRPGTRVRDVDPPTVPGPSTLRPGSFATPAVPASMTPFRTPLFSAQAAPPPSFGSGGFGLAPEDEIDEYLRRFGG